MTEQVEKALAEPFPPARRPGEGQQQNQPADEPAHALAEKKRKPMAKDLCRRRKVLKLAPSMAWVIIVSSPSDAVHSTAISLRHSRRKARLRLSRRFAVRSRAYAQVVDERKPGNRPHRQRAARIPGRRRFGLGDQRPPDAAVSRATRRRSVQGPRSHRERGGTRARRRHAGARPVDLPRARGRTGRRAAKALAAGQRLRGADRRHLPRRWIHGGVRGNRAPFLAHHRRGSVGGQQGLQVALAGDRAGEASDGAARTPCCRNKARTTPRPSRSPSSSATRSTAGRSAARRRKRSRTPPSAPWSSWRAPSAFMVDAGTIPPDVLGICRRLREAGHAAFIVGGSVRDLLIGRAARRFRRGHQRACPRRPWASSARATRFRQDFSTAR
jgi:hypothetical protein